jgi:hypothetical protein
VLLKAVWGQSRRKGTGHQPPLGRDSEEAVAISRQCQAGEEEGRGQGCDLGIVVKYLVVKWWNSNQHHFRWLETWDGGGDGEMYSAMRTGS